MKAVVDADINMVILQRGEELFDALQAYATSEKLTSAALLSGIGGAENVTLSFYDLPTRQYIDRTFDEPLEILSLQGNLAEVDSQPFWHIHGTFGTSDYRVVGGHVKSMKVALTAELLLRQLDTALLRSYDEATGLKLITPR